MNKQLYDIFNCGFVWRAVTIDGRLWAYRRELPSGNYEQFTPDMKTMRSRFFGDVMQYFNPISRG